MRNLNNGEPFTPAKAYPAGLKNRTVRSEYESFCGHARNLWCVVMMLRGRLQDSCFDLSGQQLIQKAPRSACAGRFQTIQMRSWDVGLAPMQWPRATKFYCDIMS
jgi:hypothetical protein